MKKLLCLLFGHNLICVHTNTWEIDAGKKTTITAWDCSRCTTDTKIIQYDEI